MSTKLEWKRNIWTGRDLADITENQRMVRQPFNDGTHLYYGEFWGDHSLAYPVRTDWCKTLPEARRKLAKLAKAS